MARVRSALLAVVMLATGIYFVLYLYGWEWYRAFMAGIIFLAAELAAVAVHLSSSGRTSRAVSPQAAPGAAHRRHTAEQQVVADVLSVTPPRPPDTFRWLRPRDGQFAVFIPLLLGAGVVMSGVAWVMERVAGALYGDRIDDSLIRIAAPLVPPDDLLDVSTEEALLTLPGHWDHGGQGPGEVGAPRRPQATTGYRDRES